jgi:hypothetical protein
MCALRGGHAAGRKSHGWRLQCRPALKHTSYIHTTQAQKLECGVAWSGAVFRHLVCILLYWLLSLLPFWARDITTFNSVCLTTFTRLNKGPWPREHCILSLHLAFVRLHFFSSVLLPLFSCGCPLCRVVIPEYHTPSLNNSFVAILPVNTNQSPVARHCTLIHSVLAEPAFSSYMSQ